MRPVEEREAFLPIQERGGSISTEIGAQSEGRYGVNRKRTVTLKSLMDENAQLKMREHQLTAELAALRARSFWPRLVKLVSFGRKGGAR